MYLWGQVNNFRIVFFLLFSILIDFAKKKLVQIMKVQYMYRILHIDFSSSFKSLVLCVELALYHHHQQLLPVKPVLLSSFFGTSRSTTGQVWHTYGMDRCVSEAEDEQDVGAHTQTLQMPPWLWLLLLLLVLLPDR